MANLKLEYGFTSNPYPILVSGGEVQKIDLAVMISQPGPAVPVQSILIEIPVGADADYALSAAPRLPDPVYDQTQKWVITIPEENGGAVSIKPRAGAISIDVVNPIEFTLSGINVNHVQGFVAIKITELSPAAVVDGYTYRLEKLEADFPVRDFYAADPVLDDLDRTTTLYWEGSGAGKNFSYRLHTADVAADQGYGWMPKECLSSGDCYSAEDGRAGVQTPQLADDTTFALDVIKADPAGERVVHKTLFVTVRVAVPYFSQAARLVRMLSSFVFLRWRAFNASRVAVRLNDDIVDANAPVDPYINGYLVTLGSDVTRARFHLTAYARSGDAVAYYAAFPDVAVQNPIQLNFPNQFGDAPVVPTSIAVAANVNLAVAGCHDDESARLIDLNTRQLRSVSGIGVPYLAGVALSPDGKQVIVGGQGVRGFDTSSGKQLWATGNNCDGMVMSANGKVLLLTYANMVGVIDMTNPGAGSVPIAHPYPGYPPGQAGKMLTAALNSDGTIGILGMNGGYVAPLPYLTVLKKPQRSFDPRTISLAGYTVSAVAISASGNLALATVYQPDGTSALLFIDVQHCVVTNTIPLTGSPVPPGGAINMGASYAFILTTPGSGNRTVLVLDLDQKKVITTLDAGPNATAMALGVDNSCLTIANANGILIV